MFDNITAVITGAASGIGAGLAKVAIQRGYQVYLVDKDHRQLETLSKQLGIAAHPRVLDVSDEAAVENLADELFADGGKVDYLFNNAGILSGGLAWQISSEDWRKSIDVNLLGVVYFVRSFVPRMMQAGHPCHLVNNASIGGLVPAPMLSPYTASKFGVVALTEALTIELQRENAPIIVHLVAPGPVKSAIYNQVNSHRDVHPIVRQMGEYTLEAGMDPVAFGDFVFRQIDEGRFWIISHPEMADTPLLTRAQRIVARENPTLQHYPFDPRDE